MKKFQVLTSEGLSGLGDHRQVFWGQRAPPLTSGTHAPQPPVTGKTSLQRQTGTGEPLGWPRRLAELPDSSGRNVALISDSHQLAERLSSKPHQQADFLKTACFKVHANVLKGVVYKQNPVPWEPSIRVPIHSLCWARITSHWTHCEGSSHGADRKRSLLRPSCWIEALYHSFWLREETPPAAGRQTG